jgi:hypothetical protein
MLPRLDIFKIKTQGKEHFYIQKALFIHSTEIFQIEAVLNWDGGDADPEYMKIEVNVV